MWSGTAEPVCAASAEPREDPTMLVECHPHADPDAWLLENPGFVSGGNLRWWRDQFAPIERGAEAEGLGDAYDFLSKEASTVPAGAEGLVFLPCMQGAMAPEWNGAARGRVLRAHARAHPRPHDARRAGGERVRAARHPGGDAQRRARDAPADDRGGRRQGAALAADQGGRDRAPVRVPTSVETTATGAAILAAVGAGVHATVADAVEAFVSYQPEEHEPDPETREAYDDAYRRYRDVYFAL